MHNLHMQKPARCLNLPKDMLCLFIMNWVAAVPCVRHLDRRDRTMKRAKWEEGKRPRMLTIYTNHQGGNIVHKHKTIKFDWV